ncbi:hypothetical protein AB0B28_05350 [Glycomyces sp. NPDC046736]|uniref:hypothetical protein n=1 Tax=Glycomyces sp. NPDC046736 TaxID=3155615 RepID=UPI0033D69217
MRNPSARRALRHVVVLVAAFMLVVGAAPSSAHAANNYKAWVWAQNPQGTYNAGLAQTWSQGENILLEDFHADGWGVRAQLQTLEWDPAGYRYWKNHGGVCFDDTSTSNAPGGRTLCDRNVAEGKEYRIHIWASKSGATKWHNYSPGIPA